MMPCREYKCDGLSICISSLHGIYTYVYIYMYKYICTELYDLYLHMHIDV